MRKIKIIFVLLLILVIPTTFYFLKKDTKSIKLLITNKTILVNGKNVTLNTIIQPNGTWGYYGTIGDNFDITVKNNLKEPTVIHWHGLILPNKDDGTELTQKYIAPGESYSYNFKLKIAVHSGCTLTTAFKSKHL